MPTGIPQAKLMFNVEAQPIFHKNFDLVGACLQDFQGKGYEIYIPEDVLPHVYVAGAVEEEGRLLTSGGRVLGVTAVEPTLAEAIEASYDMLDRIDFANKYYRADIGQRALKAFR